MKILSHPKALCSFLFVLFTGFATSSSGSTYGYWRFEGDSSGFLQDYSGNGRNLSTASELPVQTDIPASGAGSAFPTTIPQTGASNAKFADFSSATATPLIANNPNVSFSEITIELFANKQTQSSTTQYMFSDYTFSGSNRSFAFGVAGTNSVGGGAADANTLFIILSVDGTNSEVYGSGITMDVGDDYYLAVSVDTTNAASGITFYAQNLTDGGTLQSSSVAYNLGNSLYNANSNLRIGGYYGDSFTNQHFLGDIDEVRFSDSIVGQNDLLISVPEPEAYALGLGIVGLLMVALRRKVK